MSAKKKKHAHKTNAIRKVEAAGIEYGLYEYDAPEGFLDGVSVAETYAVGDCAQVGNLRTVIWSAYEAAMRI